MLSPSRSTMSSLGALMLLVILASGSPPRAGFATSAPPNTAFPDDGWAITDVAGQNDFGRDVALQPDGKLVVVGTTVINTNQELVVVRYSAQGSPDPSFGTQGLMLADWAGSDDEAMAVALHADGRIVIAGWSEGTAGRTAALMRLTPTGALDPTFGSMGTVTTSFDAWSAQFVDVAVHSNGSLLAVGTVTYRLSTGLQSALVLARFHANGTLDTSFGSTGFVITRLPFSDTWGEALAIQPDGKIVVGGAMSSPSGQRFFAAGRYTSQGTLDETFGDGGTITTRPDGYAVGANALVLQPNGKILMSGVAIPEGTTFTNDLGVVRYTPDGRLDTTFGISGTVVLGRPDRDEVPSSMGLHRDGRILIGGTLHLDDGASTFLLVRLTEDGTLDPAFGTGGLHTLGWEGGHTIMGGLAIQADDTLIAAGHGQRAGQPFDLAVTRYPADLSPPDLHQQFLPLIHRD